MQYVDEVLLGWFYTIIQVGIELDFSTSMLGGIKLDFSTQINTSV